MVSNLKHNKEQQKNHDNLFKHLVTTYFKEYLEFAQPEVYLQIDFSKGYVVLSEFVSEVQMYKGEGNDYTVDTAIQAYTKSGEKIVIHIEYQSYKQKKFPKRMRRYHLNVVDKYECEVISHAICFLKNQSKIPNELNTHISTSSKSNLHFIYDKIELYSYNIKNHMNTANPFILACLGLMKGINKRKKFALANLKLDCYLNLQKLNLDEKQNNLIASFFEIYIPLSADEQEHFLAKVRTIKKENSGLEAWIMKVANENTWVKQKFEEGVELGEKRAKEDSIRSYLEYRISENKNNPKQLASETKSELIAKILKADIELVDNVKLEFNELKSKKLQ